jgi:hypothetical protein
LSVRPRQPRFKQPYVFWRRPLTAHLPGADPSAHLLNDPEAEARYSIKLADVLARAEAYKTGAAGQVGLLKGVTFYATRQVETEFDVLKRIVESHKGKVRPSAECRYPRARLALTSWP